MQTIKTKLREYKLSGIYNSLDERLEYAKTNNIAYQEFLEILLEDETSNRRNNNYKKRQVSAKMPHYKSLEDFDFNFQASINKKTINDCATCQYIEEKRILYL